jgi:hypothetical protein
VSFILGAGVVKRIALTVLALLAAFAMAAGGVVAAEQEQTQLQRQAQEQLQDGSCQCECDCACDGTNCDCDCPEGCWQYQIWNWYHFQWEAGDNPISLFEPYGPDSECEMFMLQYRWWYEYSGG